MRYNYWKCCGFVLSHNKYLRYAVERQAYVSQIKGPALFLAQFAQDVPPYNTLENITQWAKDLGFLGVQIPASDKRLIDLDKAAESKQYCDDLKGRCNGLAITELATHLIGQLVAVHPTYDVQFDAFAPKELHGHPQEGHSCGIPCIPGPSAPRDW